MSSDSTSLLSARVGPRLPLGPGCIVLAAFAALSAACTDGEDPSPSETGEDTSVVDDCPAEDPRRRSFYLDADQDGFGDPDSPVEACVEPEGYVRSATDCDDADSDIFPGAPELCDGKDNDCDERVDDTILGTGQACAAESCRQISDDRDLPTDGSMRTVVWLRDAAGPYQATCFVESPSRAWTEVTLPLAVERGWIRAAKLAGPAGSPKLQVTSSGLAIAPAAIHDYTSDCDSDVLRATLSLPFAYEQVSGQISGMYEGFDIRRGTLPPTQTWTLEWGEQLPPQSPCIGSWLLGVPGEPSLRNSLDEGPWRPSTPYDLSFELSDLDSPELAVELNAARHRTAVGGFMESELRVTAWTMLFR